MVKLMELKGKIWKFGDNVDTDAIIPARYLNTSDPAELAKHCMEDADPSFPAKVKEGDIILAGANFGCGSSREHAPWALTGYGFKAVVSTSFADIFKNNSLKNGLLPIVVDADTHRRLFDLLAAQPEARVTVDLRAQTLALPDGSSVHFPIDPFSRTCLLQGVDELGYLLGKEKEIAAFENA
jgi:3-isopropylmalate/(R)-2-methylmalate dehydratase small subunit